MAKKKSDGMKPLSEKQLEMVEILMSAGDNPPSNKELAFKLGVSVRTIQMWRKQSNVIAALKGSSYAYSLEYLPVVIEALIKQAVENKNASAAKTLLQYWQVLQTDLRLSAPEVKTDAQSDEERALQIDELRERMKRLNNM